jgi:predicted ABC-type transport system involved in lysophospholipase L1 biosynthesis ATPase subunit
VVLVTHDRDIARRGSRTITLADGEILPVQCEGGDGA